MIVSGNTQRVARILVFCAPLTFSLSLAPVAHADVSTCIASSEQALQLRQQGKLHDALTQLALCADPSCPSEVSSECTQRIASVNAAMPTLILAAQDGTGNDLYDVKVTMDGAPLLTSLDGRSIAIDPGEHSFHFETAGQPPLDKKIVLREGDKDRKETVVIGPVSQKATLPPTQPPSPAPAGSYWSTQRTLSVVSVGVGVVGLAAGSIFGGLTISEKNKETSACGTSSCSDYASAKDHYNSAITDGTVSTVAFIAGGVFVVAGAVLWFTAPSSTSASPSASVGRVRLVPSVGNRSGGAFLQGEF